MAYSGDKTLYIEDFQHYLSGRSGQVKVRCPFCDEMRSDKRDKSLSIDATTYSYHCHYCQASGVLRSKMGEILSKDQRNFQPKKKTYSRPTKKINTDKRYSESFLSWFQGRCISEDTLRKAKVTQETEVMPNVGKPINILIVLFFILSPLTQSDKFFPPAFLSHLNRRF